MTDVGPRRHTLLKSCFSFLTGLAFLLSYGLSPVAPLVQAGERERPTLRFFHYDHLGSITMVTDEAGRVVETMAYKPFGEVYEHEGAGQTSHRFTGQRHDPSTGLYFYKSRYYDPTLGRFIQPDPIVPV